MQKNFPARLLTRLFVIALMLKIAPVQSAQATPESDLYTIQWRLRKIQQRSFPELEHSRISVGYFQEADSFFQSNLEPCGELTGKRVYHIEVNPDWFEQPGSDQALEAVLAHELSHSLDFDREGPASVIWRLITDLPSYERRTDLQAIFRGYGPGLIAYRRWLYARLDAEQLARKRLNYYQPEEISLIMSRLSQLDFQSRQALQARWLEHPPLSEADIQAGAS